MKFGLILANPPYQDTDRRGKTPHKLWIEFTDRAVNDWLAADGVLAQVSPSSFRSPSNRVLHLMKRYPPSWMSFDTDSFFPNVGSTFSHYVVDKSRDSTAPETEVVFSGNSSRIHFSSDVAYLPNVLAPEAIRIHKKVMFSTKEKLDVRWDYVTCHNVLLKKSDSLRKVRDSIRRYPVLHTNRQIWWSSIRQDFADKPKVMWSRSGYTKPFFDNGELGTTDMGYFVEVPSRESGMALAHNLNSSLFRYVFQTAKWSGFGNERVFRLLPELPFDRALTDEEMFGLFSLDDYEVEHVKNTLG